MEAGESGELDTLGKAFDEIERMTPTKKDHINVPPTQPIPHSTAEDTPTTLRGTAQSLTTVRKCAQPDPE